MGQVQMNFIKKLIALHFSHTIIILELYSPKYSKPWHSFLWKKFWVNTSIFLQQDIFVG